MLTQGRKGVFLDPMSDKKPTITVSVKAKTKTRLIKRCANMKPPVSVSAQIETWIDEMLEKEEKDAHESSLAAQQ